MPASSLSVQHMINSATGWFEIAQFLDKKFITIANLVEQQWLSRYSWMSLITYNKGPEFVGKDFKNMVRQDYDIKVSK